MGKYKSHRSSLKMAAVIRKKAKAKRQKMKRINETKQFPKRTRRELIAPQKLPNREEIQKEVREGSIYLKSFRKEAATASQKIKQTSEYRNKILDEQINELNAQRVSEAKEGYRCFNEALEKYDTFIELIDSRDPIATRILDFEQNILESKKNLVILMNKVDLIPSEVAISWIETIKSQVNCTVGAIMSSNPESTQQLLQSFISGENICVFGMKDVGKSTLCRYTGFYEIPAITSIVPTQYNSLLGATINPISIIKFAEMVIKRSFINELDQNIPTLCRVLKISETNDPIEIIDALSEMNRKRPRDAAKLFVNQLQLGEIKFYSLPPEFITKTESGPQMEVLSNCVSIEVADDYFPLTPGEFSEIDQEILKE